MDELRGPTIQIVLHIKEGVGFGFLRSPFIVSGSLNGYILETDPAVPSHTPAFDAELVWEADKRRFRSLRVQNVPIKVEVHSLGTQGKKDKVGYFLLSLLGAQPRPSCKMIDIKHTWQRLLGVRSEAKCCQPKLLISLSIEDRVNNITPRNELRMFHCNEVAYILNQQGNLTTRSMLLTLKEYESERGRRVSLPELSPRLLCEEGLIQLGAGRQLFVLSFLIGSVENLDMLLPKGASNKEADCYITYTVFTHDVMTDRVPSTVTGSGVSAQFNQRTSLRLRSDLSSLSRYFAECSHLITKIYSGEKDVGICSMDLRKLIPTDDIELFTSQFCNTTDKALTIHERCFVLRCDEGETHSARRPYIDVEMTLKYLGVQPDAKPSLQAARSATHLDSGIKREPRVEPLDYRSGSCTNLAPDLGGVAYTNLAVTNTNRYKNASGDAVVQTTEIADLIKKMCATFKESQEALIASHTRPFMTDMQVQCDPITSPREKGDGNIDVKERKDAKDPKNEENFNGTIENVHFGGDVLKDGNSCLDKECEGIPLESSRSDTFVVNQRQKDLVKLSITPEERSTIMQKFVDELEDWKEKQQEIFKVQLKRKEEYHLDLLSREWSKKQVELESKLSRGIDQCRHLAADLSRATDDFRLRGFRNCEREKKLLDAKKALEAHYTAKYQELRLASQKMEDDMMHQLKLKDMRIEELEMQAKQLQKQIDVLKNNLKNNEKENENKYSGLTKDQTANLIQELRCLEEKLDSAVQSKAFFKEQWGRAVRELHLSKLRDRRHVLTQLQQQRRQLQHSSDTIPNDLNTGHSQVDMGKLKDDFYVDLLANSPGFDATSLINSPGPNGMEMYNDIKDVPRNPLNEKLTELITQRDRLIQQDNPDENILKQLNHEIRSMLVNCT